jgi:hypothetical protein
MAAVSMDTDYSIGFYDANADILIASHKLVQKTACQILDVLTPACRLE